MEEIGFGLVLTSFPLQVLERIVASPRNKRLWDIMRSQGTGDRDRGKECTSILQL